HSSDRRNRTSLPRRQGCDNSLRVRAYEWRHSCIAPPAVSPALWGAVLFYELPPPDVYPGVIDRGLRPTTACPALDTQPSGASTPDRRRGGRSTPVWRHGRTRHRSHRQPHDHPGPDLADLRGHAAYAGNSFRSRNTRALRVAQDTTRGRADAAC